MTVRVIWSQQVTAKNALGFGANSETQALLMHRADGAVLAGKVSGPSDGGHIVDEVIGVDASAGDTVHPLSRIFAHRASPPLKNVIVAAIL